MSSKKDRINLRGGVDYADLNQLGVVEVLTITTNQIGANNTAQFKADSSEDEVDTINTVPSDANLPKNGRIVHVKVNVESGSTDSKFKVVQSSTFNDIEQVVNIDNFGVSDDPASYVLGGGLGTPFINKQEENQIYFEIDELSGNAATYSFEVSWYSFE